MPTIWIKWRSIYLSFFPPRRRTEMQISEAGSWPSRNRSFWREFENIGRSVRRRMSRMRMRPILLRLTMSWGSSCWTCRETSVKIAWSTSTSLCSTCTPVSTSSRPTRNTAKIRGQDNCHPSWTTFSRRSSRRWRKDISISAIPPSSARRFTTSVDGCSRRDSLISVSSSTPSDHPVIWLHMNGKAGWVIRRGCWWCWSQLPAFA